MEISLGKVRLFVITMIPNLCHMFMLKYCIRYCISNSKLCSYSFQLLPFLKRIVAEMHLRVPRDSSTSVQSTLVKFPVYFPKPISNGMLELTTLTSTQTILLHYTLKRMLIGTKNI